MRLLIGIIITAVFVLIFRNLIKKYPVIFYLLAIVLDIFYLYGVFAGLPAWLWKSVMFLLQKNVLGFSFFAVVMFIGVLSERTQIYKSLVAIRAELSIVACILSVGHIVAFGNIYLVQAGLLSGALSLQYVMATVAALLAVILMIPLLITSFKWIRAKMSVTTWKRLQKTSYLFYALVFAHLLLFIGPSSLAGASGAVVTFIVYTALFVTYIVLRIAKELRELNAKRGLHGQKAGI